MRYPLATAAKKSVTAEHAWITARSLYDKAHASLEKLKTNAMVKKIYYQRTGLKNMDLTAGQHARLQREQSEMQQSLGVKYVDAEARVDAHIRAVETAELEKAAKLSVWQAAKAHEKELQDEYELCQTKAKKMEYEADAIVDAARIKEEENGPDAPTLGWETDSQVFDEPFANEQHRPAERSRSPPTPTPTPTPSMNGGRGEAATLHFNWIQDDMQRRRDAAEQQQRGYAATDPGPARGGWDAPPQPRGWDVPRPPSYSSAASAGSFVSTVAQEPSHPRMMPSNAEDRRDPRGPGRDPRDAAGAGPAPKRARATRHDAAAKSSSQHGGMERFLEKQ
jgi:hypothetical protein